VTEGLRKELFQDEQHPEHDNSKKDPINKNDEHIFDNKAQGKAAAGRKN
jgi:L-rhamnose mutarotase